MTPETIIYIYDLVLAGIFGYAIIRAIELAFTRS